VSISKDKGRNSQRKPAESSWIKASMESSGGKNVFGFRKTVYSQKNSFNNNKRETKYKIRQFILFDKQ
jgi:hypothetical protein